MVLLVWQTSQIIVVSVSTCVLQMSDTETNLKKT